MKLKKRQFKLTLPQGEMNIVSFMDVLTTLLFFLLLTATFTKLSIVPASGVPSHIPPKESDNSPKFTLELIVHSPTSATVWLGPLAGLRIRESDRLRARLAESFKGNDAAGYLRKIEARDKSSLISELHEELGLIKASFPEQMGAVVAFTDPVPYQDMVDLIAAVRSLDKKSPGIEIVNIATGREERTQVLFPQVIISEWNDATEGV